MTCEIQGIPVYYEQSGEGKPILFIHGWSVDHRLMSGCFEPVFNELNNYCRIYLDLPGMGKTPSADWIRNSDNTLAILVEFINTIIGDKNFLLAGESYGGYLSMGLIHELGNRIDGVLLLCPMVDTFEVVTKEGKLPERKIIWCSESLSSAKNDADVKAFLNIAVIATPEIFEKYKNDILSGVKAADNTFLSEHYKGEYNPDFEKALREISFDKPACILTGRQDNAAGYFAAYKILDRFPRATFAVLDCAGHNLQIDNEPIFTQLVKDWIWRVELENKIR
jgi:pimeloyl-ACP methyl ester carboxylesterase